MPIFTAKEFDTQKNVLFILVFSIIIILYVAINVILTFDGTGPAIFNLISVFLLLIYIGGRAYGELNLHKDFVEITKDGLKFRETPAFGMGWLPKSGYIQFSTIKKVDLVEISHFLRPENKTQAILVIPTIGKHIIIGSKLSQEQKFNALLALKGLTTLSSTIQRLLGPDVHVPDTVKQAVDFAKGIWNKMKEGQ